MRWAFRNTRVFLLEGAGDFLDHPTISGAFGTTFNGWTDESWVGELVVYDRVPGGAGHVERIVNALDAVLAKTLERVEKCKGCTDLEGSCYACLRTYSNQSEWEQLKRAPVIDWLSGILKR